MSLDEGGPLSTIDHEFQHRIENDIFLKEGSRKKIKTFAKTSEEISMALENRVVYTKEFKEIKDKMVARGFLSKEDRALLPDILSVKSNDGYSYDIGSKSQIYAVREGILRRLNDPSLTDSERNELFEMNRKLRTIIKKQTGLRPYSFRTYDGLIGSKTEALTTFMGMTMEERKKMPKDVAIQLAQLRLDSVLSMNNPSEKLIREAKNVCAELKQGYCQPCKIYKAVCNKNLLN